MSKYNNKVTEVDGIRFASIKEANRYVELKILQRAGKIRGLKWQVPFVILPEHKYDGKTVRAVKYIADFVYIDENGSTVVEDVKGFKTQVYGLKKKLMFLVYGINIKEV